MSLRTSLLPVIDSLRGIPDTLGFRQYTVTVRIRQWSGARVGLGTASDTDTVLHTNAGASLVKVRRVSQRDVIASGGKYQDMDLRVGPFTPAYTGGGVAVSVFNPPTNSNPQEIFWNVVGPGVNGWFTKISQETDKNLSYFVILRAASQAP